MDSLDAEIAERARDARRFYRHGFGRNWPDWRDENRAVLLRLLALRRALKRDAGWPRSATFHDSAWDDAAPGEVMEAFGK
jgi:hypothetical protein